jgi:serine acetyltransferase
MNRSGNRLLQDWRVNRGNPKGQLIMLSFRLAHRAKQWDSPILRPLRSLIGIVYRVNIEWILGVEIPWKTSIGPDFRIFHGMGTVINDAAIIGSDVTIRHSVTIGHTVAGGACPIVGDGVDIGAGAMLLGEIHIGDRARIGAGAIVVKDVPEGVSVIGPAAVQVRP